MKKLLIIVLCFTGMSAFAQATITMDQVKDHIGDSVKICTKIFGGKYLEIAKGSPTFLNAGGYYPDAPLTLVIEADTRKTFDKAPEQMYKSKQVCVTGKIELYKDKPQIIIKDKTQIVETAGGETEDGR